MISHVAVTGGDSSGSFVMEKRLKERGWRDTFVPRRVLTCEVSAAD